MPANFHRFGAAHLVILGAVLLLAAVLAAVQRRLSPGSKWLRVSLGVLLLLDWAAWYGYLAVHGQLAFPDQLPLELCDVTLFLIAIALFNLSPAIFDLAYYGALAGSSMALLTPDLWEPFYLAWSGLARPRPGSVGRAMLAVNIFAVFDAAFDAIFKTNYMYLCAKPENATLLSLLGPWPWYILTSEGVALVLFLLLYLPFWLSARKRTRPETDRGRN